jgi:hypothetical protein
LEREYREKEEGKGKGRRTTVMEEGMKEKGENSSCKKDDHKK